MLGAVVASCTQLRTLALCGQASAKHDAAALPQGLSQLTALSSFALRGLVWTHTPGGLPAMPQLRRLSLTGQYDEAAVCEPRFQDQLSSMAGLQTLTVRLHSIG